jgi:enamine deaminase RidA (YjgF/YER057c/UK114 family)
MRSLTGAGQVERCSKRRGLAACLAIATLACMATTSRLHAADIVRTPLLGSDFPILAAVSVPAGSDTIYLSGAMGSVIDKTQPADSRAAHGDTEAQTLSALTNIKGTLARLGLGMGDVVKMTIFMAGDSEKGGKMDFMGMMKSYRKFFGTPDQPNLPTRSAVQVAALAAPWGLIEIEVTAIKTHPTN